MSYLLFIFGLGRRGFLLREAHPQAWDEFPGQGTRGEGRGQDGEAAGQQQALQCVLAVGTGVLDRHCCPAGPCQPLPWSQRFKVHFWTQPKAGGEKLLGFFHPGSCWQSTACNSCRPLPKLGTGKAGREQSQQLTSGLPSQTRWQPRRAAAQRGGQPGLRTRAAACTGTGGVLGHLHEG